MNTELGDIKYSILEPYKFNDQHEGEWVIMQGQSIKGSDLSLLSGMNTLPDARGMFLRSMNLGRVDGDVDSVRQVGSFQGDSLHSHHHSISPCGHANGSNALLAQKWVASTESNCNERSRNVSENFQVIKDKSETRPKNIALFIYIKINNTTA